MKTTFPPSAWAMPDFVFVILLGFHLAEEPAAHGIADLYASSFENSLIPNRDGVGLSYRRLRKRQPGDQCALKRRHCSRRFAADCADASAGAVKTSS